MIRDLRICTGERSASHSAAQPVGLEWIALHAALLNSFLLSRFRKRLHTRVRMHLLPAEGASGQHQLQSLADQVDFTLHEVIVERPANGAH